MCFRKNPLSAQFSVTSLGCLEMYMVLLRERKDMLISSSEIQRPGPLFLHLVGFFLLLKYFLLFYCLYIAKAHFYMRENRVPASRLVPG